VFRMKFLPPILKERILGSDFERRREPASAVGRDEQASNYLSAGNENGGMYIIHLFHCAHISQVIEGVSRVLDLSCGPAMQLLLTAQYHPDKEFVGIDLSAGMAEATKKRAQELGVRNVTLLPASDLPSIAKGEFGAITSTMALHHLPTHDHVAGCFMQMASMLERNGAVYISDFVRLNRRDTVEFMVANSAYNQPRAFNEDFRHSMLAAFSEAEFDELRVRYLPWSRAYTAWPLGLFHIIKTESQALSETRKMEFVNARNRLPQKLRKDLDDLRSFFRLAGLRPDPFT